MTLYFITSNKNKFEEFKQVIPEIELLSIDLPEIQETDSRVIIRAKLMHAFEHKESEFLVEDTPLCLDCLNGLPGPFIKWFLDKIGPKGIYEMAEKLGNINATALTMIGYASRLQTFIFLKVQ